MSFVKKIGEYFVENKTRAAVCKWKASLNFLAFHVESVLSYLVYVYRDLCAEHLLYTPCDDAGRARPPAVFVEWIVVCKPEGNTRNEHH